VWASGRGHQGLRVDQVGSGQCGQIVVPVSPFRYPGLVSVTGVLLVSWLSGILDVY